MITHEPWMDDRLEALLRGENPTLILRMKSGYAVLGDYQALPGYCVLVAWPRAASLNELSLAGRAQFMQDMTLIGDAINAVCKPAKLNYAVMMNYDTFLHGHIQARYAWEPDEYRRGPAWNYPQEKRCDARVFYTAEASQALLSQLQDALQKRLETIDYGEDGLCP